MGKKGVILDNGKKAKSSMSLYWQKSRSQAKHHKKQYEPTQQQQLNQRVQSGFQKWKIHKQKLISKQYQKIQKHTEIQKIIPDEVINEQNEQYQIPPSQNIRDHIKIPGFKSKQTLKNKLKLQHKKQVSQKDNILKLPNHITQLSQQQIIRTLRDKKNKNLTAKSRKQLVKCQDLLLGEEFLEEFKPSTEAKENQEKVENYKETKQMQQPNFFKSDILNQVLKGNTSVLLSQSDKNSDKKQADAKINPQQQESAQPVDKESLPVHQYRPLFIPRALVHKK